MPFDGRAPTQTIILGPDQLQSWLRLAPTICGKAASTRCPAANWIKEATGAEKTIVSRYVIWIEWEYPDYHSPDTPGWLGAFTEEIDSGYLPPVTKWRATRALRRALNRSCDKRPLIVEIPRVMVAA